MLDKYLNKTSNRKEFTQSLLLLLSSFLVMAFMIGINFFLTKLFDPEQFGTYSLVINIFTFSQVVFNFGVFYSVSRLIAQAKSEVEEREIYSTGLLYIFVFYLLLSLIIAGYVIIKMWMKKPDTLNALLLISIPFCWVFLFNAYHEAVLQGNNRIGLLAQLRVYPKLLFLLILIPIFFFKLNIELKYILILFYISLAVTVVYVMVRLRPTFRNSNQQRKVIISSNHAFGFQVYLGSLFAIGASSLTGILIAYFGVDNKEVGFYALAYQLSSPLSLIPNVIATTFFKKFVNLNKIDAKLIWMTYAISISLLLILMLIAKPFILTVYGGEFRDAINLVYLTSIGTTLYGIADFYNKYLLSKGMGKELMRASFMVGGTLIISNLILIQMFGAKGAAISIIVSGFTYLVIISRYYKINQL